MGCSSSKNDITTATAKGDKKHDDCDHKVDEFCPKEAPTVE